MGTRLVVVLSLLCARAAFAQPQIAIERVDVQPNAQSGGKPAVRIDAVGLTLGNMNGMTVHFGFNLKQNEKWVHWQAAPAELVQSPGPHTPLVFYYSHDELRAAGDPDQPFDGYFYVVETATGKELFTQNFKVRVPSSSAGCPAGQPVKNVGSTIVKRRNRKVDQDWFALNEFKTNAGPTGTWTEATRVRTRESIVLSDDGLWVYCVGGMQKAVEYQILGSYRQREKFGSLNFFQAHHAIQDEWALQRIGTSLRDAQGKPLYDSEAAPAVLLLTMGRGDTPHRLITDRQNARKANLQNRRYKDERNEANQDLIAAGLDDVTRAAVLQAEDAFFCDLWRRRSPSTLDALTPVFCDSSCPQAPACNQPVVASGADPSVGGKYHTLKSKLVCPNDRVKDEIAANGEFREYGHYGGGTGCSGAVTGPEGYWVWVPPAWYVWEDFDRPSAGKRYRNLLGRFTCAGPKLDSEVSRYGDYRDDGWSECSSTNCTACGDPIPGNPGFFVWAKPTWYRWGNTADAK